MARCVRAAEATANLDGRKHLSTHRFASPRHPLLSPDQQCLKPTGSSSRSSSRSRLSGSTMRRVAQHCLIKIIPPSQLSSGICVPVSTLSDSPLTRHRVPSGPATSTLPGGSRTQHCAPAAHGQRAASTIASPSTHASLGANSWDPYGTGIYTAAHLQPTRPAPLSPILPACAIRATHSAKFASCRAACCAARRAGPRSSPSQEQQ